MKTQEIIMLPQQEMVEIKDQVSSVQQKVLEIKIENADDMSKATDILHTIRQTEKYIEEKKTNITRPLMFSLSQVRDLFKPMESSLQSVKKIVKEKMLSYQIEVDDKIKKEQEKIAKKVQSGYLKPETAAGKLETLGEVGKGSQGEVGKSSIREVKKIRVVDEFAIPREYLMVNLPMITEAILRKGAVIPGVETFLEKSIVSR